MIARGVQRGRVAPAGPPTFRGTAPRLERAHVAAARRRRAYERLVAMSDQEFEEYIVGMLGGGR